MTTFDKREEGFENLFAHDEEMRFKATARRNKRLAAWAADLMGTSGEAAVAYQNAIVVFGVENGGDDALVERLGRDLSHAGQTISPARIRTEMNTLMAEAVIFVKRA